MVNSRLSQADCMPETVIAKNQDFLRRGSLSDGTTAMDGPARHGFIDKEIQGDSFGDSAAKHGNALVVCAGSRCE